jgi:hypothetical protein
MYKERKKGDGYKNEKETGITGYREIVGEEWKRKDGPRRRIRRRTRGTNICCSLRIRHCSVFYHSGSHQSTT